MTIRVNTSSKGYNTDNEIVLYVHPDGYGYGQISVNGSSDDVDLKILPKGNGKVEVCNLHITGISGSIEDKINSIESVIATVDISGSSISALSLSDKVTDIENDITTIDVSINDILTKVDAISGKSSVYEGGTISNSISAYTAKNNKIAFSFKVKEDKIVGITPYEGLPKAMDVLGMTAYVETDGKEYYATENGWIALQAEGVYKTVKLTDDFISHTHYASIGPEDASNILFGNIEYVDIESSEECVPVDHTHLIRWKKDGNGKIVARILFDNHINTPHLIQEDEIGFDIISTAVKNGLDENQVFQSCTLTENISGSPHTHTAHITVKQALELYKKQREFIVTNTIQSESNLGYYDVDAVDTNTGEHTYSQHIHYVTWKYEAGQNGIIRQEHLGQYSISENESDELHNYTQYDVFGHIKPCTASINVPVENNNEHTHDIVYNKSIFNEIFTALETTKFNKTGGIIHGRVGIKDGFTYIDADKPTSGAPYEMVIGTNSTVTISGALSGAPYWQHTDNDAIRIGSNYVNIYENRNLGVGDFSYSKPTSGAIHAYRNYDDTKVVIESKGSFTPSLELVSGTDEPTLSGSQIGGEVFVNNTGNTDYSARPIGEVIFKNKLADRGFSFSQGDDVNLVLNNQGDLEVLGNLIVYGTSSVISSTETHFADNIIELNSISGNANMTGSALQVGFAFKRGQGKEDYFLLYNEQTESMVAGVSGVFNAMPFHEGSIIEGQGVVFGSGLVGENVDTYRSDANNFRYSNDNGLYIDSTGDIALDINNNRIVNISQGINSTDAINLAQLNSAIGAIIQDHGDLTGIDDDDHLQYIRVDGTRPFSNVVKYDSTFDIINNNDITHKSYVDGKFSSVGTDLSSHTTNTNNPHNVTIEQLGGSTFSQNINIPNGSSSSHAINKGQFDSHTTNTNNPHNVTIEQLGGSTFSQRISIPSGVSSTHAINKSQFDTANNHSYRQVAEANATVGGGWVTVAQCTSGRHHGEIIVTDADSSDHSFIRIDWMRSYVDSSFTVINCGGHANRITGVRVLYQTSDNTYGVKKLQVYVTANSNYGVKIHKLGDIYGYSSFSVVTPVVQNSISGYALHGKEVTNLDTHSFAVEEGIRAGGAIRSDDHIRTPSLYINGSTNNSRLSSTDWGFRNQTDHGYIQFGPANTGHAHIYTDRPNFYFNKELSVNGATVWNSGNDGSGSGLDADKLDGIQASSFLRSDADDDVSSYTNRIRFHSNTAIESSSGEQASLSVFQSTAGHDAFMSFHVGGDYAAYFGLDGSDNQFKVGGWSMGNVKHKVWHGGNDGSGSGLDADLLDGQQGSYYLNYNNLTNKPTNLWTSSNDGSGSGLDADKLDGQHGSYYLDKSTYNEDQGYKELWFSPNGSGDQSGSDTNNTINAHVWSFKPMSRDRQHTRIHLLAGEYQVQLWQNGNSASVRGANLLVYLHGDVTFYQFDPQNCNINFVSVGTTEYTITFKYSAFNSVWITNSTISFWSEASAEVDNSIDITSVNVKTDGPTAIVTNNSSVIFKDIDISHPTSFRNSLIFVWGHISSSSHYGFFFYNSRATIYNVNPNTILINAEDCSNIHLNNSVNSSTTRLSVAGCSVVSTGSTSTTLRRISSTGESRVYVHGTLNVTDPVTTSHGGIVRDSSGLR